MNPRNLMSTIISMASPQGGQGDNSAPQATGVEPKQSPTLDEPVSATIMRDLRSIGRKISLVLFPRNSTLHELRNWDLWGPLLLCLVLAILLGINAKKGQAALVFAGVFVIVWCGAAVVTVNAQLLGGNISFFQSVCTLGYCIFPLDVGALVCMFIPWLVVRTLIALGAFIWASFASVGFLSGSVSNSRKGLAVYPIFLFYLFIAWMIVVH